MENALPDGGRPMWTLFFDGTLFKRYQDYLKSHDLTKILNNRANVVSNNSIPCEPPVLNDETDWLPPYGSKAMESNGVPPMSRMTSSNPEQFLTEVEKKRRNRRTTGCVVLGILCLGAIAAAVALIIHFVFVKSKEHVSTSASIHIPGSDTHHQNLSGLVNDSRRLIITTVPPRKTLDDVSDKMDSKGKPQFILLQPGVAIVTPPPKLAQSIEMKDMSASIGSEKKLFSCNVFGMPASDWKTMFLRGEKKHTPDGPFEFILTSTGEFSLKGNNSNMVVGHTMQENSEKTSLEDVLVYIAYTNVECGIQDRFTCGVQANGETDSRTARVIVTVGPTPEVDLTIPVQVIEGQLLKISASWMAGFPDPHGNLTWSKTDPGETTPSDLFEEAKTSWTLRRHEDKCETVIDSHLEFSPKLEWNGTEIIAQPELAPDKDDVTNFKIAPTTETLYIVPEDYCDGYTNDTRTPHPYTCEMFVRCMPGKIFIYPCPGQTCFHDTSKQCD